jgi:prepilin peptidase CpaA
VNVAIWVVVGLLGIAAGFTDWRWRRIPNWLTVPGAIAGIALNTLAFGWSGFKSALLGLALGLALLLPLVLVRSLGAGDWKLAGALGAFVGPEPLITLLIATVFVAGLMAIVLIVVKKRVKQTLHNIWQLLLSLLRFHMPSREVSLDNPDSLKIPFGVAMAITVLAMAVQQLVRK